MFKIRLVPQNEQFYDLFEQGADNLVASSEKFVDLFDNYEDQRAKAEVIKRLEGVGDDITHEIIGRLHRSFVTPIDREDIALLANRMDDMLDFMWGSVKYMLITRIEQPTPRAIEIAYIIQKLAIELREAVYLLRHHGQLKQILPHCVEIHRLENDADALRGAALADLYDEETSIREMLKWRDIYNNLEQAVDYGEDVANVLEGIVLKYA